jgi:hypothetical protein
MSNLYSTRFEALKAQFLDPPAEFSPIPFWFWNDKLSREELIRQIHDFHAKEVDGFVIHPRMGLPRAMPYLSESYMDLVEAAVTEASMLGMQVILYDEGMYPSGSACGMVVARYPEYASRGLQLREYPCQGAAGSTTRVPLALSPSETLVSAQAVCKLSDQEIELASITILEAGADIIEFTVPPAGGDWSVLLFIDTASKGTIRGVHPGQDDGEPDAPLAADLLNPEAVQAFIALTHDRYYERLARYFGTTVIAMFTDEPDLLGRGHLKGLKPWTSGFMGDLLAGGGREENLPVLWFEAGGSAARIRAVFELAIRNRMAQTYYKQLADWCDGHGIGLTGHPAGSDDIGLLEHFHIPGQDVVWRYIAPEQDKSLTGVHSTMGKCSSDSARHRGKRKNLNEAFGVCGIEGGWTLTADNMKWYLDWLFVRGVNLISPHAFYYSIRDERRDERPPDVGPNNIWWPDYAQFARYIKRMSWIMTDSMNGAKVAVLAGAAHLPWRIVKPLYEQQIEFNYLEESLMGSSCLVRDGALEIAGYRYQAILIEDGDWLTQESWQALEAYAEQGLWIIQVTQDHAKTKYIGQSYADHEDRIPEVLAGRIRQDVRLEPASADIRISRVTRDGIPCYVIVNEGEVDYKGNLQLHHSGYVECWRPWSGVCEPALSEHHAEGQRLTITIERRECLVVAVDQSSEPHHASSIAEQREPVLIEGISTGWRMIDGPVEEELSTLASWTEWPDMENFSGTLIYEKQFDLLDPTQWESIELDLGVVHELARLWVNGQEAGVRMWAPYRFEIGQLLQPGHNVLSVSVTNSLTNRYDGKSWPSGMLGPVRLLGQ